MIIKLATYYINTPVPMYDEHSCLPLSCHVNTRACVHTYIHTEDSFSFQLLNSFTRVWSASGCSRDHIPQVLCNGTKPGTTTHHALRKGGRMKERITEKKKTWKERKGNEQKEEFFCMTLQVFEIIKTFHYCFPTVYSIDDFC